VQVDQVLRRRQAELHHRDQAVAAGQRPGIIAQCREQFNRIGDGRRPVVAERARDHGSPPLVVFSPLRGADVGGRLVPPRFGGNGSGTEAEISHETRFLAHEMRQV